ncbi:hypothetical protein Cgig2_003251 [Carnegiea gigantea]|uniref:Uncharacterized protein n=1 Tax=Carnegiea gigantea TaxID=171969 RepID=A0A9Q1Q740_9CARY|nr:hypothetical protein Cgig2_003251 [Carnegiea gigantea]
MWRGDRNDVKSSRCGGLQKKCHNVHSVYMSPWEPKRISQLPYTDRTSSFWDGKVAPNMIITNSQLLAEAMIELEEFLLGTHVPLKRVRNPAVKLTSDALFKERPKKLRVETRYSHKIWFLMEIDVIKKHFMSSRDTLRDFPRFTPPSFRLGVSQQAKWALPKGVILVDSEPNILTT